MSNYKILIIEDDKIIAESIKKHLEKWEYRVHCVTDFKEVISEVTTFKPELILLDITLPFYNGFYWCNEIRKFTKIPIIFISSADDKMNIVMAMDMGGDDFISKPFDLTVLTAKINALLRRSYSFLKTNINVIEHKGVMLNLSNTEISNGDKSIELTKNEFKIIQLLMENAGEMVSRDTIMIHLWDSDSFIDENTLTVNLTRIRKKLSQIGVNDYITTKKGMGYLV
ncbi:MAG: response regulator transcription factor [Tissierellia bacterium]|nr:response regulator transcription factor [Tissierellia bacterium]MDD3750686.1 response regulator transcription factor [Tissierellia bacterium]MDD4678627.1 response regulator transcription factor [Tissierellia bacterium]